MSSTKKERKHMKLIIGNKIILFGLYEAGLALKKPFDVPFWRN